MIGGDCGCAHVNMTGGAKKSTSGTVPKKLEDRTVPQLKERALKLGVLGCKSMKKQALVDAIRAKSSKKQ